jgi:hypothetical protein
MQVYIKKYIYDDIYNTLLKYKTDYNIDKDIFEKFCKNRIKTYMKQINLKNNKIDNKYGCSSIQKKKNNCKCRTWSNGYGLQCSNTIKKNDLCKTHNNMLEKHSVLRYGTIDLHKPRHDFISGKLLKWK